MPEKMTKMSLKLRDYQLEAVQSAFDYYDSGKTGNPIIVAATGAGKSLIIGNLIKRIMEYPNQRIIMATHVKELIEQNYLKLVNFWPNAPVGIYSAGIGKKQGWQDIVCGGVQSMYKKAHVLGHRDIILIDESHLLSPDTSGMYISFINDLKKINPYLKVIGLTATPWRLKGGSLLNQKNAIFTDIIYEIGIGELVKKGYLSPLVSKSSIIQANMSGVKITAGDFNLKQAESAVDKEELTKAALDEVEQLAIDRKHFLFFCAGIKHSEHVAEALAQRGWEVAIITCNTPKLEREVLLRNFKNSTTRKALINNAVLTTGVDLPNIDCIVLLRATASSVLYLQMLGRGMRLSPEKKNCLVLDYAGNIERFGAVDLIQIPKDKNKNKDGKPAIAPQKICSNCREPVLIMLKECPSCGYQFPETEKQIHDEIATIAPIMSAEIKSERFEILKAKYSSGVDKNGNTYIRISYYDNWGLIASEFIHFAYKKSVLYNWFNDRKQNEGNIKCPINAEELLARQEEFKIPKAIYTKKSGKYQEVVDYEF
jgi:DNA repair protein RadD